MTAQPGDHVPRLAARAGFRSIDAVWQHPDNAELRAARSDPCILLPGDVVHVPDRALGDESVSTGGSYRFRVGGQRLTLAIAVENWDGTPLNEARVAVSVDGLAAALQDEGSATYRATIQPDAVEAVLTVDESTTTLRIGGIDPIDTESGLAGRLANLGYPVGVAGLPLAVEEFQLEHGLAVDGIAGPNTRGKLEEVHGC